MLHGVFMQVFDSVETEPSPSGTTDPFQLGQVHRVAGRRPSAVALGDAINRGHAFTGWSIGGASLSLGKQQEYCIRHVMYTVNEGNLNLVI